jgi:hypothetical protein
MEGSCSTGQSPQWAVVPMEEEELLLCVNVIIMSAAGNIVPLTDLHWS